MRRVNAVSGDEVLFEAPIPDKWAKQLWGASSTRQVIITRNKEGPLGIHIYVNDRGMLHLHPNTDQYQCIVVALLKELTELRKKSDKED